MSMVWMWIGVVVATLVGSLAFLHRREAPLTAAHLCRVVMSCALAVGTVSHLADAMRGGLQPYPGQPMLFNGFWTSLMVLDPVAAVLVILRPRVGLVLIACIMTCDVVVNSIAFGGGWPLLTQVVFAVFVAFVTPLCWRESAPHVPPGSE